MNWDELDISDDAKRMLDELLMRKQKLEKLRARTAMFHVVSWAVFLLFAFIFYEQVLQYSSGEVLEMLRMLSANYYVLLLALLLIACVAIAHNLRGKTEETKEKYEALRKEAIDKFKSDWQKNIKSEARDTISNQLLNEFDINLVYKS